MNRVYFSNLCLLFFLSITPIAPISVTQQINTYPEFCKLAASNNTVFQNFRKNTNYEPIVETCWNKDSGMFFVNELNKQYPHLLYNLKPILKQICIEDKVGDPISFDFPEIGVISPTTLRYIKIAADLEREFGDLSKFNIGEIGAGFGGQCKIINNISGFKSYTIFDLPEINQLINKYLSSFSIKNIRTIDNDKIQKQEQFDLVISNYAFSEIGRTEQSNYMQMIIDLAPRGYVIYGHSPTVNPFTLREFLLLLQEKNRKVKVLCECIGHIVIWHP